VYSKIFINCTIFAKFASHFTCWGSFFDLVFFLPDMMRIFLSEGKIKFEIFGGNFPDPEN